MKKLISIIVPAYNEELVVHLFYEKISEVLDSIEDYRSEIVFIDDGSIDKTRTIIRELASKDKRVSLIALSRNFGKEAAMSAGLDHVKGDAVVIFDIDLQDPPELLFDFIQHWEAGFDNVFAKRAHRRGETLIKKITAAGFYKVVSLVSSFEVPRNTGDCRLLSRRAVDAIVQLREHHRFMKGLFAWIGYPSIEVEYNRDPRASGETKFNYWKLWNFALEGLTSFTTAPLRMATYIGGVIFLLASSFAIWVICKTLIWGDPVQGFPTLMVMILFFGGIQLFFIGVLGEYLGRIFNESKQRPLYFIEEYIVSKGSLTNEH